MKVRLLALKILADFEKTGKFREHFEKHARSLSFSDRGFLRELSAGTVRYLRLLDFWVSKASKRPQEQQDVYVRNALRIIGYQLYFMGSVPPYAAVNETVEALKVLRGRKKAAFVNAVGRKLTKISLKEEISKIKDPLERMATEKSFETWMVKRWIGFYGFSETQKLLEALNRTPSLFLRVNRVRVSPQEFLQALLESGVNAEPHPIFEDIFRIVGRVEISKLPGYKSGWFYIQDPASYAAAYFLNPKPGEKILDLAAAPGGKSTALCSLTAKKAKIVSVDVDKNRIELLKENLSLQGCSNVKVLNVDITKESLPQRFDAVLLDAPCSATGVIRRRPEGKWNKSLSLIRKNSKLQKELLLSASKLLKEGGRILFSTCSLEREEGEEVAEFARKELGLEPMDFANLPKAYRDSLIFTGVLRLFPHRHETDGFFYALFKKV